MSLYSIGQAIVGVRDRPMAYLAALLYRLHTLTGLVAGLFFSILGITGAALAFRPALEQALYIPKTQITTQAAPGFSWDQVATEAVRTGQESAMGVKIRQVRLRPGYAAEFIAHHRDGSNPTSVYVDPATGRILSSRAHATSPFEALRAWHTGLTAGPYGRLLVSRLGLLLLLQIVVGLAIWWLRGKPGNWHTVLGLTAALPLFLLAYSGFRVMTTRFPVVAPVVTLRGVENKASLDAIVATATKRRAGFDLTRVDFPQAPSQPFVFWFGDQNPERVVYMDPYGAVLPMMIPTELNQVQQWHAGPGGGSAAALFRLLAGISLPLLWVLGLWRQWSRRRGHL